MQLVEESWQWRVSGGRLWWIFACAHNWDVKLWYVVHIVCVSEILKVVSAVSTLVLFFCPCCANFWPVYAHRMCIGAYFWLQLC